MTVYSIAIIDSEGDCKTMYTPGGIFDDEGTWANDPTKTVVHVTTELSDHTLFMNTNYYKAGKWVARDESPGAYYNWIGEEWVLDSDKLFAEIRQERTARLYRCDWTLTTDSPLTDAEKVEWIEYRQALRGVPSVNAEVVHLDLVVWPDAP